MPTDPQVLQKLRDAHQFPGAKIPFDPAEAEQAGAFEDDALSVEDALASVHDQSV